MKQKSVAVVGAAETTQMGRIPGMPGSSDEAAAFNAAGTMAA